jgi:hypothetical protein
MSFGSGGGDGGASWAMVSMLQQERDRANAEAARVKAQNDAEEAKVELKRVQRSRAGGLAAFTTNGMTGYSDRTLGGGNSLAETV